MVSQSFVAFVQSIIHSLFTNDSLLLQVFSFEKLPLEVVQFRFVVPHPFFGFFV
jgi:hypothetical protein